VYSNNPHTTDDLKMAITEYIRNVDRVILNTVFENAVQRVNKRLVTGGGHFNITFNLFCNNQMHRDFSITLYNVTLRRFRVTIVAVVQQYALHILIVCLWP
jgi:hypothetical protein